MKNDKKCIMCKKEMNEKDLLWCFYNKDTNEYMHFECYGTLLGRTLGKIINPNKVKTIL